MQWCSLELHTKWLLEKLDNWRHCIIFTELTSETDWKSDEIKDRFSAWNYYFKDITCDSSPNFQSNFHLPLG